MDTTKRHEARQLEAAEHKLLLEGDHRAKNALALVQGIVRLTKLEEAGAFAEAVQGRVDALARAHAILAEGRWRDVSLDRVVRAEIEPLGSRRVRISGHDARLTTDGGAGPASSPTA